MDKYTTSKCSISSGGECPYCGFSGSKHPEFGSPFVNCFKCSTIYVYKKIKEPALLSPIKFLFRSLYYLFFTIFVALSISMGVVLIPAKVILNDTTFNENALLLLIIIGVLTVVIYILYFLKLKPLDISKEMNESLQRLEDENYVLALKKHHIPFAQDCVFYNNQRSKRR